jgi:hypothetical protein
MKTKSILGLAAVVLAFATGGREAAADHVFQLVDVTFGTPGGTATGTFTTNDAITGLVTYDITTSSVAGFPGFEYTPVTAPVPTNFLPGAFILADGTNTHFLNLAFGGGLTVAGATLDTSGNLSSELNLGATPDLRDIVSGSVVGVPEPSALVLGGIAAAAGLGLWAWRRRAALRAPGGDR